MSSEQQPIIPLVTGGRTLLRLHEPREATPQERAAQARRKSVPRCKQCGTTRARRHGSLLGQRPTNANLDSEVFCSRLCGYHWAMDQLAAKEQTA